MDGSSVTLDKVSIQIEASAKEAGANIEQLTRTLSELRSAVKGGFNNLSSLAKSLEELKTASSNLGVVATELEKISSIGDTLKGLSEIPNPTGLNKTIENLERLPSTFAKIDGKALQNVARVSQQLSDALSPLASKMYEIAQGYRSISKLADTYGVSVTKVREYTKQSTDHFKQLSRAMSTVRSGFKSIQKSNESMFKSLSKGTASAISKIKQIGLSLLGTRTIFTATRKAVSEYMAMDAELTWKVTNNWKALGAQLAPAIENVTWLFKQFIRVIYSVILALTGIDLIARANEKAMKGWGKAAKDTLGNLQKFDDLNVVEFPKASGGGDDKLIDLDPIDLSPIQKVIDWVRKLRDEIKKAWATGKWKGVGKVLATGMNEAMRAVDFDWIEEKFSNIASMFGDFLQGVVDEFDWKLFGEKLTRQLSLIPRLITTFLDNIPWDKIGEGLNTGLQAFKPEVVIDAILGSVNSLILGFQDMLLQIDGKQIGQKISDAITSILSNFNTLLDGIEWSMLTQKLLDAINAIEWDEIGTLIGELVNTFFTKFDFGNVLNAIFSFVDGLFVSLSNAIETANWSEIGENIAKGILKVDWSKLAWDIGESIDNAIKGISDFFVGIGKTIIHYIFTGSLEDTEDDGRTIGERFIDGFKLGALGAAQGDNGISKVFKWISFFIKGFFGIHSPSTWARDEIGANISLGLANGLSNIWKDSKKHFENFMNNVSKYFSLDNFKSMGEKALKGLENGFKNTRSTLTSIFRNAFNGVIGVLNNTIDGINNKLSISVGGTAASVLKSLGANITSTRFQLFSIPRLPQLETGTNRVPQDGPYYLHANEAVVPKKYNPALGGGNDETNRKLDLLIDAIDNMETTTVVNIGNDRIYKQQQRFIKRQNDKYGTDVNL